jgi:hypothetical protein
MVTILGHGPPGSGKFLRSIYFSRWNCKRLHGSMVTRALRPTAHLAPSFFFHLHYAQAWGLLGPEATPRLDRRRHVAAPGARFPAAAKPKPRRGSERCGGRSWCSSARRGCLGWGEADAERAGGRVRWRRWGGSSPPSLIGRRERCKLLMRQSANPRASLNILRFDVPVVLAPSVS